MDHLFFAIALDLEGDLRQDRRREDGHQGNDEQQGQHDVASLTLPEPDFGSESHEIDFAIL